MTMHTEIFGNRVDEWILAAAVLLSLNGLVVLFVRLGCSRLVRFSARTATFWDDAAAAAMSKTRLLLLFPVTVYLAAHEVSLPAAIQRLIVQVAIATSFLQVGIWASAFFTALSGHFESKASAADAGVATSFSALGFVVRVLLWSSIALLALSNLGVDVTTLIAGLGVGGIAVALALQNVLGDLFASFSIVLDKPFVVGDFIVIDDFMGTVERVGVKTTRLRSLSGEQLVLANADLLKSRLRNYKRMQERRALFCFGLVYGTPAATLRRIPDLVRRAVESQRKARFERAHFKGFGESSLDFEVVYWVLEPDYQLYMDIQQAINLALLEAFAAERVEFAFPSRSVFLERPSSRSGTDPGQRAAQPVALKAGTA